MKYNSTLLRHFRKPAHAAELLVDSAAAVDAEVFADSVALAAVDGSAEHLLRVSAGSYDQGAMVVLFIVWQGSSESGRIGQARFLAFGEPSVIALADALCAALEGLDSAALADFSLQPLQQALGLPNTALHVVMLFNEVLELLRGQLADRLQVSAETLTQAATTKAQADP